MSKSSKWMKSLIIVFAAILLLVGVFMVVLDPYFHYHAPIQGLSYTLDEARYQNDGIVKHFTYDAIITGSSMTECFKTSDLEALYDVTAIKVPFSGGSFKEVNDLMKTATEYNPNIKMIFRGLDCNRFFNDKDDMDYDNYPSYLYDKNPFNDVSYLYNKDILLTAVQNIIGKNANGAISMSFDNYCNWTNYYSFGKDVVDDYYHRETLVKAESQLPITAEDYSRIDGNIEQNILALVEEYPNIEFYLFITPYSIYYFDYWNMEGKLERQLLAEKYIIEKLLPYENIHLYSFYEQHDVVNNLDNYRDVAHYKGEINTQILNWIHDGVGLLTKDNYEDYCKREWDYYMNYDYDAMFE